MPALALPEVVGAVARRTGVPALGEQALATLLAVPGLRVVAVDVGLGTEAAQAATRLGLRGADAVYAATARRLAVAAGDPGRRAGRARARFRLGPPPVGARRDP